jgi:hypothetical protein
MINDYEWVEGVVVNEENLQYMYIITEVKLYMIRID